MAIDTAIGSLTKERIIQAADTHASLLSQMAALEHAPLTVKQQEAYLDDLKLKLLDLKSELMELRRVTSKERKVHQELRDSFARRYAHKMTGRSGKFVSKVEDEEREYLDALHQEQMAEEKRIFLDNAIDETEARVAELHAQAVEYEKVREKFELLYRQIFDGPTPDYPEEDEKELAVTTATEVFDKAHSKATNDLEAKLLLDKAEKVVATALEHCEQALLSSGLDIWGGGILADFVKRDNLSKAQACLAQAKTILEQAYSLQKAVGSFNEVQVASGHVLGDVIFDNIFSDYHFHKRVSETKMEMDGLYRHVKEENEIQTKRSIESNKKLEEAKAQLANARKDLEKIRREVFELAAHGGMPPVYEATEAQLPISQSEKAISQLVTVEIAGIE